MARLPASSLAGTRIRSALPNFNHTGFALSTMQPMESRLDRARSGCGHCLARVHGLGQVQDPRFLTAADWALRALEERPDEQSPLYEVLLPYGALAAAA